MRFSHSKLNTVRKCMKLFHYKYILKEIGEEDDDPKNFGNLIHKIAENYTGGGKKVLLKLYNQFKDKYDFDMKTYKKRLKLALKNIHTFWKENLQDTEFKTEQEITENFIDDISLTGKIDVMITVDNKVRIIDYKTSKSTKYDDHTDQLAMYMFLIHKKYDIPYENMECEIVYLSLVDEDKKGNVVLTEGYENISRVYSVDESDVAMLGEEIEAINHRIQRALRTDKWIARPSWFNCTYCPYKDLCDEKWTDDKKV